MLILYKNARNVRFVLFTKTSTRPQLLTKITGVAPIAEQFLDISLLTSPRFNSIIPLLLPASAGRKLIKLFHDIYIFIIHKFEWSEILIFLLSMILCNSRELTLS